MDIKDFLSPFLYREREEKEVFHIENIKNKNKNPPDRKCAVSGDIKANMNYIKSRFSVPVNSDVVVRNINAGGRKGFIVFIDGMADGDVINKAIIEPLVSMPEISDDDDITADNLIEKLIWHSQAKLTDNMQDVVDEINFGGCGVFIDKIPLAVSLDTKGWATRGIDKPENEQSIYGPQEAFGEMIRTNCSLVRKILKNERLICESLEVGNVSRTTCILLYIDDVANPSLVNEVRERINGIDMDYVISVEEVSLMIEDNSFSLTTRIMSTERPDRTARALSEGRVAVIMNGSPKALIFPTNAAELTHSASDAYMRVPYANMSRTVRLIAMFISVFLPGLYLASTLYHKELIPTYLLYSISASRENVPFSSLSEMIIMELSFEIIREASIRVPGPIGSTLGIVGGLILGQAAVDARIVSPIMIIVVALTGICSFAVSDYSLGWTNRILRLVFIFLGAVSGFYAIAAGTFAYLVYLCAQSNFGIPFMSPLMNPKNSGGQGTLFVKPIWKKEYRPKFLKPQDERYEPDISRKWKKKK
ncbi:MAG: spore germination protein [Oscillospiraceae bacterium]|nr:spore germination protein [Oscillospiraceae bacterium]